MAEDELCASLRRIADTVETNGGWHIAAIKVRAGAEEIERLREDYRNCDEQRSLASDMCDALIAERDRLRAARDAFKKDSVELQHRLDRAYGSLHQIKYANEEWTRGDFMRIAGDGMRAADETSKSPWCGVVHNYGPGFTCRKLRDHVGPHGCYDATGQLCEWTEPAQMANPDPADTIPPLV